jgi:hypothetical protein
MLALVNDAAARGGTPRGHRFRDGRCGDAAVRDGRQLRNRPRRRDAREARPQRGALPRGEGTRLEPQIQRALNEPTPHRRRCYTHPGTLRKRHLPSNVFG